MFAKLIRYAEEIGHCWHLGAGVPDRASLARDTVSFHLQNARGHLVCGDEESIRHCRIRLPQWDSPIDFHYRLRGGDLFILHEVLLDQCYRIPALFADSIRSIVDLGGNIGSATLAFSRQFPEASFVCVEPLPQNAAMLAKNVGWLGKRARIVQAAIGGQDGEVEFVTGGAAWEGKLGAGPSSIRVPCYRLETLLESMDLERVDLLKVDIEGAEREVFASRGAWWKKVRMIIAELHHPYSFENFESDMQAIGFRAIAPDSEYGNRMPLAIRA